MTGKTHMLLGSVCSMYFLSKLGYTPNPLTCSAAIIGSLIPDMDHPKAKINQKLLFKKTYLGKLYFYISIAILIFYFYGFKSPFAFTASILLILIGFSKHRMFTHSFLGMLMITSVVYMGLHHTINYVFILSFTIGVISHIVGDFLTPAGVALFYPFTRTKYKFFFTLASGKKSEPLLCMALICWMIYFYFKATFFMNTIPY